MLSKGNVRDASGVGDWDLRRGVGWEVHAP
jgi:hypothetical protein